MKKLKNKKKEAFRRVIIIIKLCEADSNLKNKRISKDTYKLGPFSSWPAISKDTPNGRDCGGKTLKHYNARQCKHRNLVYIIYTNGN